MDPALLRHTKKRRISKEVEITLALSSLSLSSSSTTTTNEGEEVIQALSSFSLSSSSSKTDEDGEITQALSSLSLSSKRNLNLIDSLSDDLLSDIFTRLPSGKFVTQCKQVCKRWRDLISRPLYVTHFLSRFHSPNDDYVHLPFMLQFYGRLHGPIDDYRHFDSLFMLTGQGLIHDHHDLAQVISAQDIIPCCLRDKIEPAIINSSLDLVLYRKEQNFGGGFVIANVITKQWLELPYLSPRLVDYENSRIAGLACKQCPGGMRIFRVICIPYEEENNKVVIFSSETGRWTEHETSFPIPRYGLHKHDIYTCNGTLYWWTQTYLTAIDPFFGDDHVIPVHAIYLPAKYGALGVCQGRLQYLVSTHYGCKVWELKDYKTSTKDQWSLKMNVSFLHSWSFPNEIIRPLECHPYKRELIWFEFSDKVVLWNLQKQDCQPLRVFPIDGRRLRYALPFSLAVLPWWPTPLHIGQKAHLDSK